MARALWTGSLSFGLVEIPVTLHTADSPDEGVKFNLVDRRSMKPVGYQRINKETGEEVPWGEIVRGYEYEKGEYVVLTDEELARANAEKSDTIDIAGFVDLDEIAPVYFEKPYYVKPVKKGGKGYALLHATLERTKKAAIAKVVLRSRQYVCAIMPRGPVLALVILRYADEVKSPESLDVEKPDLKKAGVSEREVDLAEQLVDGMAMKWKPSDFRDEYREDVMRLIERKIKSGKTEEILLEKKKAPRGGEVLDLMPLLKQSLEKAPAKPTSKAKPRRAAAEQRPARRSRKGA